MGMLSASKKGRSAVNGHALGRRLSVEAGKPSRRCRGKITVLLKGGLGNQMFQYALARHLALKTQSELFVDLTLLNDPASRPGCPVRTYDLPLVGPRPAMTWLSKVSCRRPAPQVYYVLSRAITEAKHRLGLQPCYRERTPGFDPTILQVNAPAYLDGHWQSEKYFRAIEEYIRQEFLWTPREENIRCLGEYLGSVQSVCVNVRRTDYVSVPETARALGFVGVEYYLRAVDLFKQRVPGCCYFVFSDDPDWCAAELLPFLPASAAVVGHELAGERFTGYLWLMAQCRHFIIPNSTFAWWAAWLSDSPEKIVVAPSRWFGNVATDSVDIVPDRWFRV